MAPPATETLNDAAADAKLAPSTLEEAMLAEADALDAAGKGIQDGTQENVRPVAPEPEPEKPKPREPEPPAPVKPEEENQKREDRVPLSRLMRETRRAERLQKELDRLAASREAPPPPAPDLAARAEALGITVQALQWMDEQVGGIRSEFAQRFEAQTAKSWLLAQPEAEDEGYEDAIAALIDQYPEVDNGMSPSKSARIYHAMYLAEKNQQERATQRDQEAKSKNGAPAKVPPAPEPSPAPPNAQTITKKALTPGGGAGAVRSGELTDEQLAMLPLAEREKYLREQGFMD